MSDGQSFGAIICLAYLLINALQNAFRRKAMEYHPDQNQNNKGKYSLVVSLQSLM
jgi:hypothetical protein